MLSTRLRTIIISAVSALALSTTAVASAETNTGPSPTNAKGEKYCIVAVHADGSIDYVPPGSIMVTEDKNGKRTTWKCEDGTWVEPLIVTAMPVRTPLLSATIVQ